MHRINLETRAKKSAAVKPYSISFNLLNYMPNLKHEEPDVETSKASQKKCHLNLQGDIECHKKAE